MNYLLQQPSGFGGPTDGGNIYAALQANSLALGNSGSLTSASTLLRRTPGLASDRLADSSIAFYQGKGYWLTSLKTWEEAQADALGLNGHLVTLNNAEEEAWLKKTFGSEETFWIGLSDAAQEGDFRWVNGEPLTYQNWAPGQPDNHADIGHEDYAVLSFRDTGQWNDANAFSTHRGIVEIDLSTVNITELTRSEKGDLALDDITGTWEPYRLWGQENFSVLQSNLSPPTQTLGPFPSHTSPLNSLIPTDSQETVLRIRMPAGSASPAVSENDGRPLGGGEFLGHLRQAPVEQLRLRYSLRFSENFDFVKGGKLPGLYGGTAPSGGKIPDGTDGFSTRFMWRGGGTGEVYAYLPDSKKYGTSLGRGQWQFKPGTWHVLEQELTLNDPGQANGQLRVWLDSEMVLSATNLQFRTANSLKINGIYVSSFFGGDSVDYATNEDVYIDFANFELWEPREVLS